MTMMQVRLMTCFYADGALELAQVEEKPDVTYSDVGGCKEQIEKLREVVETPLLTVRLAVCLDLLSLC